MTAAARAQPAHARGGAFRDTLHAEWTKFRTVRGWVIATLTIPVLVVLLVFLAANGTYSGFCSSPNPASCGAGHPFVPTGPGGEAVADSYEFVGRTLDGDGTITARVTSLTGLTSTTPTDVPGSVANSRAGLAAWAKAGLILTARSTQGAPYAAVMVTGAHGVRFQDDYTHDTAGRPGTVGIDSPRWLRLTRAGKTVTAYDSTNGQQWTRIGSADLAGLPATVRVGLFVTSPVTFQQPAGTATDATAGFDHVTLAGRPGTAGWRGESIGTGPSDFYPTLGASHARRTGNRFVVTGSGDIAAAAVEGILSTQTASSSLPLGLIVALFVLTVLSALYISSEYRRGLIRTTLTAIPNRRHMLAAKATVLGLVAFATGAIAAAIAIPLGEHILRENGAYVFPASTATELRIVFGTAAFLTLTAIAVLAIGTILRGSAGAIGAGLVAFVLPYILASAISGGAEQWLFRLTPPAGLAILQALPYSARVSYPYTYSNGYYPLSPWAGLAVLVAYTLIALATAAVLLHRRDA